MTKTVEITDDMRMIAQLLGTFRALVNRSNNVNDAKIGPQSGVQTDQDGILGELAFAQLQNVWPDLTLRPRTGSADGVIAGRRYDVKATRHKNGRLVSTMKDNPDVDMYVLAIIHDDHVEFPGYAFRHELHHESRIADLGHGESYVMTRETLRKWKDAS